MPSSARMRATLRAIALGAALVAPAAHAAPPPPHLTTIFLDAGFEDWDLVLAGELQATPDGAGSAGGCGWSTDRDCLVPDDAADLRAFAWTWDAVNLYLYARRDASANATRYLRVFVDLDRDMTLGPGDRFVRLEWSGNRAEVPVTVFAFTGPQLIPLRSAFYLADGFDPPLPAAMLAEVGTDVCALCAAPDGLRLEAAVPWSLLGGGPGPIFFHVSTSSARGDDPPYDDNLGGPAGGIGDTGFHDLRIAPAGTVYGVPGGTVRIAQRIENHGNIAELPNLYVTAGVPIEICFWSDPNGDGDPADGERMACDVDADGRFQASGSGDTLPPPEWDSDADGRPDPGVLRGGSGLATASSFDFVLEIRLANNPARVETVVYTGADITSDPADSISVPSYLYAGVLLLSLNPTRHVLPGDPALFPHSLRNQSGSTLTANLQAAVTDSLPVSIYRGSGDGTPGPLLAHDAQGDGVFETIAPGGDTDSDGAPDTGPLAHQASFESVLVVEGPVAAGAVLLDAIGPRGNQDSAIDEWEIAAQFDVTPADRTLADGTGLSVAPGQAAFYAHRIRQSSGTPRRFVVDAVSAAGWRLRVFSDPDQDGNAADGTALALPALLGPLGAAGGTASVVVLVEPPLTALPGDRDTVTLFVRPQDDPANYRTARDETAVSLAVTARDPAFAVPARRFAPCTTVWLRTAGLRPLRPAGEYRVMWYDPDGVLARATALATDSDGAAVDSLAFPGGGTAGAWGAVVEEWTGTGWSERTRLPVWLERDGRVLRPRTEKRTYLPAGEDFVGHLIVGNANRESAFADSVVEAVVLAPGAVCGVPGGDYLAPDGRFLPYLGAERTFRSAPVSVPAGDSAAMPFTVSNVSFPTAGTFRMHVFWMSWCGGLPLASDCTAAGTEFEVAGSPGDSDGDGLTDIDEGMRTRTDALDGDTDDDGLSDGEEDGVALTSPLAPDTDGDTLPDGLESGVVVPLADTDLAAGAFAPDGDPLTTTDPLATDTDTGGVDDGAEDRDADGRVDAFERDPNDPSDDPCDPSPAPEVRGLRVVRNGADLELRWEAPSPDLCAEIDVLRAGSLRPAASAEFGLARTAPLAGPAAIAGAATDGAAAAFLVRVGSTVAGPGALGAYGE